MAKMRDEIIIILNIQNNVVQKYAILGEIRAFDRFQVTDFRIFLFFFESTFSLLYYSELALYHTPCCEMDTPRKCLNVDRKNVKLPFLLTLLLSSILFLTYNTI